MRILYMGTPEISATALKGLIAAGLDIVGVISQPDKPRGRKYVLTPPETKVVALEHGIPVFQPATLKDEAFSSLLKELNPELIVVVAYGKILPKSVLEYPKHGCINAHVSLLPKYRGAAPMQRAIMAGESKTGVSVMYMEEGLDTGDVIEAEEFSIGASDNFESVHDKSAEISARLLVKVISDIESGCVKATPQNEALATYAAKIENEDCLIEFSRTSREIDAQIRGLSPIPLAFTHTPDGKLLKVIKAKITDGSGRAGEVIALSDKNDGEITVATGDGAIALIEIKPEGKGCMKAADFIRGRKINKGDFLT